MGFLGLEPRVLQVQRASIKNCSNGFRTVVRQWSRFGDFRAITFLYIKLFLLAISVVTNMLSSEWIQSLSMWHPDIAYFCAIHLYDPRTYVTDCSTKTMQRPLQISNRSIQKSVVMRKLLSLWGQSINSD